MPRGQQAGGSWAAASSDEISPWPPRPRRRRSASSTPTACSQASSVPTAPPPSAPAPLPRLRPCPPQWAAPRTWIHSRPKRHNPLQSLLAARGRDFVKALSLTPSLTPSFTPSRSLPLPPSAVHAGLALVLDLTQRRYRLDPLYIENPLAPQTNVTRNCFRIYRIQVSLSHTRARALPLSLSTSCALSRPSSRCRTLVPAGMRK